MINRLLLIGIAVGLVSCQKYYEDSGLHNPKYDGTVLDYIKSNKQMFDSTYKVVQQADMEGVLTNETITFFAPPSGSIAKSMRRLNLYLKNSGKDTVSEIRQIKSSVWKSVLSSYIFRGKYLLKDYPQRDTLAYLAYPGQGYNSYQDRVMNIGVMFGNAGGVQYAGYRQLYIAYIPDLSNPQVGLVNIPVASSDIQPSNGVIHVLNRNRHNFGFNTDRFIEQVIAAGIDPK